MAHITKKSKHSWFQGLKWQNQEFVSITCF